MGFTATLRAAIKPLTEKLLKGRQTRYGEFEAPKDASTNTAVVISWNSEEGRRRLFRAAYNQAFFRLAHVYQPQINPFYAGVACIVTTLNALRLPKGTIPNQAGFDYTDKEGNSHYYTLYSQLTLLNEKTERVKMKTDIAPSLRTTDSKTRDFDPGLGLQQVMDILALYEARVTLHSAKEPPARGVSQLLDIIKQSLIDKEKVMIANFDGETIGVKSGGHHSVLGAYDEQSNSVLVMDVAAHKNPWYWVPLHHLYTAMHTKHGENWRGWLVVSDTVSAES